MPADWAKKTVLITSGPTREHLDPVRYLTNASSGRMGAELAKEAHRLGAKVLLVVGPGAQRPSEKVSRSFPVTSALQMRRQALRLAGRADIIIAAAAVSDWRFQSVSKHKKTKNGRPMAVRLVPTQDIIGEIGRRRRSARPILVGFALETRNVLGRAALKLKKKKLDLIVANGAEALGSESSRAFILDHRGLRRKVGPAPKSKIARALFEEIGKFEKAAR